MGSGGKEFKGTDPHINIYKYMSVCICEHPLGGRLVQHPPLTARIRGGSEKRSLEEVREVGVGPRCVRVYVIIIRNNNNDKVQSLSHRR